MKEIVKGAEKLYEILDVLKKEGFDTDIALLKGPGGKEYVSVKIRGADIAERLFHEAGRRNLLRNLGYFEVVELSEELQEEELWNTSRESGEV